MSNFIQLQNNKTLKLTNVLKQRIDLKSNDEISTIVAKMDNYIKSKGALPIGPLIQKSSLALGNDGELEINIYLMRQANKFIHNVDEPFYMDSLIRIRNCMYAKYCGPEEKLKFAYDKSNLAAVEDAIELSNENYTIFIDQQDDNIIADIFVEQLIHEWKTHQKTRRVKR